MNYVNSTDLVRHLMEKVSEDTDKKLMQQLNWLVSRGLLVAELGPMMIVQEAHSLNIRVEQTVELVLKDKEYIEKLEDEIKELRKVVEAINTASGISSNVRGGR